MFSAPKSVNSSTIQLHGRSGCIPCKAVGSEHRSAAGVSRRPSETPHITRQRQAAHAGALSLAVLTKSDRVPASQLRHHDPVSNRKVTQRHST